VPLIFSIKKEGNTCMENQQQQGNVVINGPREELEAITNQASFSPAFIKKKLILWTIRTALTVWLYFSFWQIGWVKWTLFLTVPLNIFSLLAIVARIYLLRKKIEILKKKLDVADHAIQQKGV